MKTKLSTIIAITAIIAIGIIACNNGENGNNNPETFTVTFNANGGSPTPATQTVEKGKTATEPTGDKAPTKANYTLDGWYKESGLSTKWNFADGNGVAADTVTANVELFAKWNETPKKQPDTPRTLTFPTTENPNNTYSVTITSEEQFTADEWKTHCDNVVTALETAYGNGAGANGNRFKMVFGRDGGIKIVLGKNPTDYTNYKVGSDFNTLNLNVDNIASVNYVNAVAAMYAKNPDNTLNKV